MSRVALVLAALGAGAAAGTVEPLPLPVINALTPIDSVPSSAQIDAVHGGRAAALANLQAIARTGGGDVGVQLRAVRALTHYCDDPCGSHEAHATLVTVATDPRYRDALRGSDLLVLRAAIEALGVLQVPEDVAVLVPQLDHPSRDIRAATALALRDLGNPQAIIPLRARYDAEQLDQVRIAISDALRVLGQPVQ